MKYFSLLFLMISCTASNGLIKTSFYYREGLEKKQFSLKIPLGYELISHNADGEAGFEKQYHYIDSSVFYISNLPIHPNSEKITSVAEYAVKDFNAFCSNDTITIESQTSVGLYWKNKRIGEVNIGYSNASREKKHFYDDAINNIKTQ